MPLLSADPALAANWQERLLGLDGLQIGLVWAGGRRFKDDHRRSIALKTLGRHLVTYRASLRVIAKKMKQLPRPPDPPRWSDAPRLYHRPSMTPRITAALVVNLDLVISVNDSAVAHLAGALGKPVWLLEPL